MPFILHRGDDDRLAAIELNGFEADNASRAMMMARTYFNILNAYFAFAFDVPLAFRALHVERANGLGPESGAMNNCGFPPMKANRRSAHAKEPVHGIANSPDPRRIQRRCVDGRISAA